jgi:hypothetical protein
MKDHRVAVYLNEVMRKETIGDSFDIGNEPPFQVRVADIASGNEQKLVWLMD